MVEELTPDNDELHTTTKLSGVVDSLAPDALDASRCAMVLERDFIAAELSRRMDELATMEEAAASETDGIKKGVMLVRCRLASHDLKKMVQNTADLGSRVSLSGWLCNEGGDRLTDSTLHYLPHSSTLCSSSSTASSRS